MKKIVYLTAIVIAILGFSGCSGKVSHMRPATKGTVIKAPSPEKSLIVFMRPQTMGYMIQSSVFDIKNNKPSIVGIVAAKKKVAYEVEPGEHIFMVVGESGDFMSANLEAGKTYYALVTPRMGWWKARFSLRPVHKEKLNSEEFTKWLNACQLVEMSDDTHKWADDNAVDLQKKYEEYYKAWISKDESSRPRLFIEDGT